MFDVTEQTPEHSKSIKVIKDHHKGHPVTNLSFCDLIAGTQHFQQVQRAQQQEPMRQDPANPYEDSDKKQ